jgi:hypothetical protein
MLEYFQYLYITDPSPWLCVSDAIKEKNKNKPYDPKKSVWVPNKVRLMIQNIEQFHFYLDLLSYLLKFLIVPLRTTVCIIYSLQ